MKKKIKIAGIAAGAAILLLAAGYTVFLAPLLEKEEWIYKETVVERGTLTAGVVESGSLEYGITQILYELDLTVAQEDESEREEEESEETVQKYLKVEAVYAAEGQRIQEGDALMKFTQDSISDIRKLLQGALADARVEYQEAESEYDLALLEAQTEYEISKVQQNYAQTIYQAARSAVSDEMAAMEAEISLYTNKTAALEEKLSETQEAYQEALKVYERAQETFSAATTDNTVNYMAVQKEYLNARTSWQNAKSAVEQAQKNLEQNAERISSLQSRLALARARSEIESLNVSQTLEESLLQGENAQITYDAAVEGLKEDLKEAEEAKEKIEEQLEAFEAFVGEDGILYADGEGIVTQAGYAAGDVLRENGILFEYAAPFDMTISVDVTQEDVVTMKVGDTVSIAFTAYEDTLYEGTILSIDTTATARDSATISYEIIVGVNGDTQALYGGMTADITFITEQKEDVLYVSRKAIVTQNDKTCVYVENASGAKELKEVETGISNSTSIEILSGLEEGDVVYIASRVSPGADVSAQLTGTEEEFAAGGANGAAPGSEGVPDTEGAPNMEGAPGRENIPETDGMPEGGFRGQGGNGNQGSPDSRDSGGHGMSGGNGMEGRP